MKKIIGIGVILLLMLSLACATWKTNITTGYEVTGITLKEIHDTAKGMCDAGTIKPENCVTIKDIYTKARLAYITAGDALIVAMETEDAVVKEKSLEAYKIATNELSQLIPKLVKLAGELGIKTGGQ